MLEECFHVNNKNKMYAYIICVAFTEAYIGGLKKGEYTQEDAPK